MTRRLVLHVLVACVCACATVAVARAMTLLPGFHSPSGNIRCVFVPGARTPTGGSAPVNLLCEIEHADYAKRLQARCMRPDGSGVDWHGFELGGAREGAVTCSGGILYDPGTQRPHYVNLPYGRSWHRAPFTCRSRVTGVTCRNATGHGLFLSRRSWRAW